MFQTYECDCQICSAMCMTPCVGIPSEIKAIMDAGFGDRLCLDDWPDAEIDVHPALKGYEGEKAPFQTSSSRGCTFWKGGKCELHDKGLKPLGGRIAHHSLSTDHPVYEEFREYFNSSWKSEEGQEVIQEWKEKFYKGTE